MPAEPTANSGGGGANPGGANPGGASLGGASVGGTVVLGGRYVLGPELGSGGMATVHAGRLLGPAGFSPVVAIKRLHPYLAKDPGLTSMFADEARIAAHVRHPNVATILDVAVLDDELLLVMEYVHGESLSHLLEAARASEDPVPLPIAAAILHGVLSGLHAAHEAKDDRGEPLCVVHRDVSPQNVMVGADGGVRVLDFGIARAAGQVHTTREGYIKGKLGYVSPEQAKDGRIDRRSDVYSAGVILWEMLTGRRLFQGLTEAQLYVSVGRGMIDPPGKHREGIPPALDALVARALARESSMRFGTARDMAAALEKCVPLASPLEVGAWVKDTAQTALLARAEQIASIRTAGATPAPRPSVAPHRVRRSRRRAARAALLVGTVAMATFATVLAFAPRRERASPPASAAPTPSSEPPAADPGVTAVEPPVAPVRPARAPSAPPPRVERRKRDACDPPYWSDSKGVRHYKVECASR